MCFRKVEGLADVEYASAFIFFAPRILLFMGS